MKTMTPFARLLAVLVIAGSCLPASVQAADAARGDVWNKLRTNLFGDRPIEDRPAGVIALDAPDRAEDAATVPIAIRSGLAQTPQRYVRKLYLIIDKNPSPLGAVFTFTPDSGRADIETRVRIEDYTTVRAIAELSDGHLFMATRFVKASGGCSAPAGKDQAAALARLGRMKLRLEEPVAFGKPVLAQLMVSHPNSSGLVMDQLTRLYIPSRFVRHLEATYAGRPVMSADIDFTISENPNFRCYFVPREAGELQVVVEDSADARFEGSVPVRQESAGR